MPLYTVTLNLSRPLDEIFTFFTRPINLLKLAPPELHLELLDGPELMQLGSRLTWKGRRWGFSQKIIQEVTKFESAKLIVEEQKQGPFARWVHAHHFTATEAGTSIREEIHFEPPGGLLGRLISADFIRKDLDKLFAFRETKLREIMEPNPGK
jgi:ligand-binding SRPBCC domain-containing protein